MAYTVLARKYRSQTFDEVVGQDPIAQTLKNAIKTHRVAHAYLFTGTRGVGKTTMARILAKALNCLSTDKPTTKPCCNCDSCIAVNIGEDIDVIEIDGASNNSVDEVRKLRQNAIYRPARARHKIYIIDEVHMLSTSAFNALLKILEEPPSHVKFIFATTEPNKVIATIQSRCQRFDFNNITAVKIAGQLKTVLKAEKIKYEEKLLVPLAKMANGSMRDGLSLLDKLISTGSETLTVQMLEEFLGCPNTEKIHTLIAAIGDSDAAETLAAAAELINSGLGEVQLAEALVDCMRDLMVIKVAGPDSDLLILTDQRKDRAAKLAEKFDTAALVYNITALEKLRWTLKNSETARALLEAVLLRFALSEHFLNVDELLGRSKAAPAGSIKKKLPPSNNPEAKTSPGPTESRILAHAEPVGPGGIESIKSSWKNILAVIAEQLGNGTAGLLSSAEPTILENGTLILTFPASGRISKKMCETNGRAEQIQSVISRHCRQDVKLKFEVADSQPQQEKNKPAKTASLRENEIVNDPAVKTVLTELGATITSIEENQRD